MVMEALSSRPRLSLLLYILLFSTASSPSPAQSPPPQPSISISMAKSKLRDEHDADKVLSFLSSVFNPNISTISPRFGVGLAIKRLSKSCRYSDHQREYETYLSSLIISYGIVGMIDHAVGIYDQIDELGTFQSLITFSALLTAVNNSSLVTTCLSSSPSSPQSTPLLPTRFPTGS